MKRRPHKGTILAEPPRISLRISEADAATLRVVSCPGKREIQALGPDGCKALADDFWRAVAAQHGLALASIGAGPKSQTDLRVVYGRKPGTKA